jgi:hypothetical protein
MLQSSELIIWKKVVLLEIFINSYTLPLLLLFLLDLKG